MTRKLTAVSALVLLSLAGCGARDEKDEASKKDPEMTFVHAGEDYFRAMDNGVALTPDEVKGRNMWLVWTGGNDRFWDSMSVSTFGGFDLLKLVAPEPNTANRRGNRWYQLGLVNEPCFSAPSKPGTYGLWLDVRDPKCTPDPFADAKKYPGVNGGSYYGEPTGIMGLRLFPNPEFDAKAKQAWGDGSRYYTDPKFYNRKNLVRPFRVGMSCGFCHVGPSPIHPPKDPENPTFADLSSTVGAQYMWSDRIFFWKPDEKNFMYQWVQTFRPGAMDTSLISTDNINNPRTMNAVYSLGKRLAVAKMLGHETLAGGERDNMQLNQFVKSGPLTAFYKEPDQVWTPHVLKDGSDSVGALGALNRVYLNIGLYSEEWTKHFNPVVGGKPITPIEIAVARKNSAYWRATEQGTVNTALFFLKAAKPDRLADAPGGKAYLGASADVLAHGRDMFAITCARCHSSKQPVPPEGARLADSAGPEYLGRFKAWWQWTQSEPFKQQMRTIAAKPDFADGNYFSTEVRVPVTLLRTNLCSPLATNALKGNIWDNFSSSSYKSLPSVGWSSYIHPISGKRFQHEMPDGGRGYTRVPSLISLWSTAPFLLNNTVGPFNASPSVAGRMQSFDASIRQMLWPELRQQDTKLPQAEGIIDRTTQETYFYIPESYANLPGIDALKDDKGNIVIGPIPVGTPVNLLASLQLLREGDRGHVMKFAELVVALKRAVIGKAGGADEATRRANLSRLGNRLFALSKCPDYVVNRGHYFGTAKFNDHTGLSKDEAGFGREPVLSDADKTALVAYLKTL